MSANPATTPGETARLLLVRTAGAAFDGPFNVRSRVFDAVLEERSAALRELERLAEGLLERLHLAVPRAAERAARSRLLKVKRTIFNRRTVAPAEADQLEQPLRAEVQRYNALAGRGGALIEARRGAVFAELRGQLALLLRDAEFRTALDYSCPWLLSKYRREGPGDETDFTDTERAIHAYAAKFFSKANPFYTFARVSFPPAEWPRAACDCEVVLNTSLILDLERALLPRVPDARRRLAYLRSFLPQGDVLRFLVGGEGGLRLVSVKDNPLLRRVAGFFAHEPPPHTVGGLTEYTLEGFQPGDRAAIENYLGLLLRQGIVVEYLVEDFAEVGDSLSGVSAEHEELVAQVRRFHLACLPTSELPAAHEQLSRLRPAGAAEPETLYYVNAYRWDDTGRHEEQARRVYAELRALKAFFTTSNFTDRAYVMNAFFLERVARHPRRELPYLELVFDFLRHSADIIARYEPRSHRPPEEQEAEREWFRRVAAREGHLSAEELAALSAARPHTLGARAAGGTYCFNGSFDYATGTYYLANVFTGGGRYASRYLLSQAARRYRPAADGGEWLDVQLVEQFKDNRGYVAAMLPTGCGFEARYRHQFASWIDPARIVVRERGGRAVYCDGVTGRLLRFHFFGFVLGESLPTEHQLLLLDHADFYVNPFEQYLPAARDYGDEVVKYIPPLHFGSVCLRRAQWLIGKAEFDTVCRQPDILACTAQLRDYLHAATATDADDWYFQAVSRREAIKLRHLDLRNPLSVRTFRRTLTRLDRDAVVTFSRMEPAIEHLYKEGQHSFLTEIMIEV